MRRCKFCRIKLKPEDAMVVNFYYFCNWDCCSKWLKTEAAKKVITQVQRRENQRQREKLKTQHQRLAEAQRTFNAYIRERDKFKPCISCGAEPTQFVRGGGRDASHYKSRGSGSGSRHRFNPLNVWSSCKKCNRYLSGNIVDYRVELIKRIGQDRVNAIENSAQPRKWTPDELLRIKKIYSKKKRLYEKKFRQPDSI